MSLPTIPITHVSNPRYSPILTYPSISTLLQILEVEKPGQNFGVMERCLTEAGLVSSHMIILLPENVLSTIGGMGQGRARILRNYAKRLVLPLLGLQRNYDEPEILSVDEYRDDREVVGEVTTAARDE
jgi:hypothetical protein